MIGNVPAELVWFICPATEAYDTLLYRAMLAEYNLAEAFSGNPHHGLWVSQRHLDHRWAPLERAVLGLLGPAA